jgi:hypothetical protein
MPLFSFAEFACSGLPREMLTVGREALARGPCGTERALPHGESGSRTAE